MNRKKEGLAGESRYLFEVFNSRINPRFLDCFSLSFCFKRNKERRPRFGKKWLTVPDIIILLEMAKVGIF